MATAMPPADRPSYEQLEEIIRRKDDAVQQSYWDAHALWSISWLAHQAHESGNADYNHETYAEAAAYVLRQVAQQVKTLHEKLAEDHRQARITVLDPGNLLEDRP